MIRPQEVFARTLRAPAREPAGPCFRFGGRSVGLDGVDRAVVDRLAALLGLPVGCGPGDRQIACEREGAHHLVRTGATTQVCGSRDDLLAVLATTVPSLLLDQPGWYELHAGALAVGDEAHLFLGPSYSGKSTLAIEAWLAGHAVLGDDYLLVEAASGAVTAVPKALKMRLPAPVLPGRLERRLPAGGFVLGQLEGGPCLVLGRNLPRIVPAGGRHRIGSLSILRRTGGRRTSRRAASRYEAFAALLAHTFVGSRSILGVLRPFAAALRDQRIYVLEVGEGDLAGALAMLVS